MNGTNLIATRKRCILKAVVNSKDVVRDTEQDIILVLIAYWRMVLKLKLRKLRRESGIEQAGVV